MSQNETPMPPHQAPGTKQRDLQLGTEQEMQTRLHDIVSQIRQQTDICPKLALVLGSGLGELAQKMEVCATIRMRRWRDSRVLRYKDIEGSFCLESCPVYQRW